jgi:hypothetical protein
VIDPDLVTKAVLAVLVATGVRIGDGEVPPGYPKEGEPHVVLYELSGGNMTGPPLAAPEQDLVLPFLVASFGWRRDQASNVASRMRGVLIGRAATGAFATAMAVAGVAVMNRWNEGGVPPAEPEGDQFAVREQFRLAVTPA